MTFFEIYKCFINTCPIKGIKDWRPFGQNTLCVWLKGNRKFKVLKVTMLRENKFMIEPSSDEDWLAFYRKADSYIV